MLSRLEKILENMQDIKYGFADDLKNVYDDDESFDTIFFSKYRLQIADTLISTKYGVCWDQVELERYYLEEENIMSKSYFIVKYDNKNCPTHTFIVIDDDKNYYWLEHSWEKYRGIHIYDSLELLLKDVKEKFTIFNKDNGDNKKNRKAEYNIEIFEYEKPKVSLDVTQFYKHCENGRKIIF